VYTQVVDFPPKSGSGWHQHPGLTIVSVKTGSLLVHHGCRLVTYAAGQSFVEPPFESILVENTANTAAQSYATLVVPAGRMARIDVLVAPNCTGEGAED
jgi:quercetin dioxygenase-like cupin family protein